jgi:uncharacterized protein (TIGR02596 family)
MMATTTKPLASGHNGFTLIELLVVMGIIALIAALAISSPNLWRSTNVTTAGNLVMEDLAFARELAIANNQATEVWFLRPTGGTFLIATQIYLVDSTGNSSSYGGVHHLPVNLGMDSGSTFLSTLFVTANQKTFSGTQPYIPGFQTSYDAWSVRFMPDGSTTLSSNQYLTLHDVALGDQMPSPNLPNNYAMISIDSATGAVSLYRP